MDVFAINALLLYLLTALLWNFPLLIYSNALMTSMIRFLSKGVLTVGLMSTNELWTVADSY